MTYMAAAEALLISPDHEPGSADRVASIVRRWHLTAHAAPWRTCDLQPCDAVRREIHNESRVNEATAPLEITHRNAALAALAAARPVDEPPTTKDRT